MTRWHLSHKGDIRAQLLADRHYSRQTIGDMQFMPPGKSLVLVLPAEAGRISALWTLSYQRYSSDGFDCWRNAHFRNESGERSSDLIREALAVSLWYWRDIPRDGLHTFVDSTKVRGVKVRGSVVYGFCFWRAGFELHSQSTSERNLLRWMLPREKLLALEPHPAANDARQLSLLEVAI